MDLEEKIAHSLSVHSLVQQVVSTQKSMRRSAALLLTFTFICAILYLPVPGIAGLKLGTLFGTTIDADFQSIRFIAALVLLYYIIIFGTNYYKGLELIEEADDSINKRSPGLSEGSKKNYNASLSDNYLFDAMRRVVGKPPKNTSASDSSRFKVFDARFRWILAFGVVLLFMAIVIFGEFLVVFGLTGMGTELKGETVQMTKTGLTIKYFFIVVFAILTYLFFFYLSELTNKHGHLKIKTLVFYAAIVFAPLQAFFMAGLSGDDGNIKALHHGCRVSEVVTLDSDNKATCPMPLESG